MRLNSTTTGYSYERENKYSDDRKRYYWLLRGPGAGQNPQRHLCVLKKSRDYKRRESILAQFRRPACRYLL